MTNNTAHTAPSTNQEVVMSDADIAYEAACMEAAYGEDYSLDEVEITVDVAWLVSYIYSPVVRHEVRDPFGHHLA